MKELLVGIATNLISDLIFLLLLALLGWVSIIIFRRNPLLKFFGVKNQRRMIIYLSNIVALSGGTIGIDKRPRSFSGGTVSFQELRISNDIRNVFNYAVPSLSDKPGLLGKLLLSDVSIQLMPSPESEDQIENSVSFITLGSPAYNAASKYAQQKYGTEARFEDNSSSIHIKGIKPEDNTLYGFVERVVDKKVGRSLFYCAGLSQLGTIGAAHYLISEWRRLRDRYGDDKDFLVLLRFDQGLSLNWSIILEKEIITRSINSQDQRTSHW